MHSNMKATRIARYMGCSQLRNAALGLVFAVFSVFAGSAAPGRAWAGPPELSLPAACDPGRTCWLVNFVDHDPGPGAQDYRCGRLSYDTHKGTDIAIANDAVMNSGVNVLAAAPGRVLRVRDGEPDFGQWHRDGMDLLHATRELWPQARTEGLHVRFVAVAVASSAEDDGALLSELSLHR